MQREKIPTISRPLRFALLVILFSLISSFSPFTLSQPSQPEHCEKPAMKTLVVIRHAEKHQDGSKDPHLSALGEQRAQSLIKALTGLEISKLIASNYQRTQLTLAPLAEHLDLPVLIATTESGIDSHVAEIVTLINQNKGNAVIAGHSNTVPLIIEALGGPKNIKIEEKEYGGLYQLFICQDGKANLLKTHFGEPSAQKKGDM